MFAGDSVASYGHPQVSIGDHVLLVLARAGETYPTVYDRESGARLHVFPDRDAHLLELAGNRVLTGDNEYDPVVHLYDATSFALLQTFTDPTPDASRSFGRSIAAIGATVLVQDAGEPGVHLFDAASGAFERTLTEPPAPGAPTPQRAEDFGAVMLPFRSGALLSGTHAAHLYDLATGDVLRTFTGPKGAPVLGLRVVPLGDDLLLASASGPVYLVDGGSGGLLHTFAPPGTTASSGEWLVTVAGGDVLLANPGLGLVHAYDATTFGLRHTLRDPVPDAGSCFGAPIASLDLGLAVSDPCSGEDSTGAVYLFDRATGGHIATVGNPHGDYFDLFGTRGAFGNTLLTKYQADDDGIVDAWRPTSDGALEPGEECDDGNLVDGDGCDMNGTVTRCGNGILTAGETCDDGNRRSGDGCELDCTPTFACAGPVRFEHAHLTLRNLGGTAGDETIVLTGHLTGIDPGMSGLASGAQILIEDAQGFPIFDLTTRTTPIPPGGRGTGCAKADGWRAERAREVYVNASGALGPACAPGSAGGLTRLVARRVADGRAVRLRARHATLPAFTGPLRVVVALGADAGGGLAAPCGAHAFASLDCRANRRGTTLVCQ